MKRDRGPPGGADEILQILFPRELLPGLLEITVTRDIRETEEARARVSSLVEKLRQKET